MSSNVIKKRLLFSSNFSGLENINFQILYQISDAENVLSRLICLHYVMFTSCLVHVAA